jgi:hypothetical protein
MPDWNPILNLEAVSPLISNTKVPLLKPVRFSPEAASISRSAPHHSPAPVVTVKTSLESDKPDVPSQNLRKMGGPALITEDLRLISSLSLKEASQRER